jgi:NAD(P)-dependent dehydrogenase (short-subunit alcohol dehydrogenase family)
MPTWFITGCSTGLGRDLARVILARGWNAVVTERDPASVADVVADYPNSALALKLDVAKTTQIADAVQQAQARFGGIDVLVNNAGYGYRGAVEEASHAEIRELFDTNFFGLVAVTQALLPGMRARGPKYIVNVSSVGGRMAAPGSGFYSATKFAVEGMSDALRKEVKPLGIGVMVVEPSGFRTDFAGGRCGNRHERSTLIHRRPASGARKTSPTTESRRATRSGQRMRSAMPYKLIHHRSGWLWAVTR